MKEITNILDEHHLYSSEILLGRIDRAEKTICEEVKDIAVSVIFITINSKNNNFNKRNVWGFGVTRFITLALDIQWCSAFIDSYFPAEPTKVTIYSLLKDIFVLIETILGRLHSFLTGVSRGIIISQ